MLSSRMSVITHVCHHACLSSRMSVITNVYGAYSNLKGELINLDMVVEAD